MIAVLGDTHLPRGSRTLPADAVRVLRRASLILHAGDVSTKAVLDELAAYAPVQAVRGNADDAELRELLPAQLVVEAEGLRIGMTHSGGPRTGRHERLLRRFPGCDVVVYGHSHEPELVRAGGAWILNAGSPTERRRAPANTLAVIERGVPRVVEL